MVYGARVHCLVRLHLRPSGVHMMWCWRDTRVRALIRLSRQVLCTLSAVLVLVCLPACGVQEIGSVSLSASSLVRKWLPVGLLRDDFRKLSSYSLQSTEPFRGGSHISNVKVDLGSRGRSWVALPDEYGLSTVPYISRSLSCACSPERYSSRIFLPEDYFRRRFHYDIFCLVRRWIHAHRFVSLLLVAVSHVFSLFVQVLADFVYDYFWSQWCVYGPS